MEKLIINLWKGPLYYGYNYSRNRDHYAGGNVGKKPERLVDAVLRAVDEAQAREVILTSRILPPTSVLSVYLYDCNHPRTLEKEVMKFIKDIAFRERSNTSFSIQDYAEAEWISLPISCLIG